MNRDDDRRLSGMIVATVILVQLILTAFVLGFFTEYETAESAFLAAGLGVLTLIQLNFAWLADDYLVRRFCRISAALLAGAVLIHAVMAATAQHDIASAVASGLVIAGVGAQMLALIRRRRTR